MYIERRRRCKIPVFEKGTSEEAQHWINRYESLSVFVSFTKEEKLDELNAIFTGQALSRFTGLPQDIKKDWKQVRAQFLHQYGGGASPAVAAINELKKLKQGTSTIGEFAPKFIDTLHRAQIFSPDLQVDYFKGKIRPGLRDAVIYGRAKTLSGSN